MRGHELELDVRRLAQARDPDPAWPTQCDPQTDQWYCRVLSEDDLKGAKSIYGGNPTVEGPAVLPGLRAAALSRPGADSPRLVLRDEAVVLEVGQDLLR